MINLLINSYQFFIPPFAPDDIANLVGWYDASALPPQTDGTAITPTWTDRVGNVGTISGAGPTYNTNVQNGLPGAYFGTGQGLNSLVGTAGAHDFTYAAVVKITDTTTGGFRDLWQGNSEYFSVTALNGFWTNYGGGGAIITGSALAAGARILTVTLDAGTLQTFYENGTSVGSVTPIRNPGAIGFGVAGFNDPFFGWLLEICMYDRVLDSTELSDLHDYLTDKWAV